MENPKDLEDEKENFFKCMQNAIKASLTFLKKEHDKQKSNSTILDISINRHTRQWFIFPRVIYTPSFENFVEIKSNDVLNLPEVKSCIEFMVKNHFYEKLDIDEEELEENELFDKIILRFLLKYSIINGFEYDENAFINIYKELVEYIYTKGQEFLIVIPLFYFELAGIEMVNLENFTIRQLRDEEIKFLLSYTQFGKHIFFPKGGILDTIWCAESIIKIPNKRSIIFPPHYRSLGEKILTGLRLFKDGIFQCSVILTYPKLWGLDSDKGIYDFPSYCQGLPPEIYYKITKEDIKKLKLFWNKFKNFNIENSSPINVAIRNFNLSYDLRKPEDKLLHYIITLESLFIREHEELSYRLALRCAYFLGKNKKERNKIFDLLRIAYEIRSKVVHGDPEKSIEKYIKKFSEKYNINSLSDLINQIDTYVRESLKLFIENLETKSHDDIINEIDSKIIAGS